MKANQRGLHDRLKKLPWAHVPGRTVTSTGRGRRVTRTIKVIDAPAWTGFTGAAQVAQLRRTRTIKGKKTVEVVYLITSGPRPGRAPSNPGRLGPEPLAHRKPPPLDPRCDLRRGPLPGPHRPRTVRDGLLRNTAISLLRLAGWDNIAEATRHHAYHPSGTVTWLLTC